MFTSRNICFIVVAITVFSQCDAAKFTLPTKCSMKDEDCQKKLFESVIQERAKTGIPELDIPPMDPYAVKNYSVTVLGMMDMAMIDGQFEGISNCPFSKYQTDLEKGVTTTEALCKSIKLSGHYKITPGPLLQTLAGDGLGGEGNGGIQLDNMKLKMSVPFHVEKRDDGEIYIVPHYSDATYSTNEVEKITFSADSIKLGEKDISDALVSYLNKNWKVVHKSFGNVISDKIMAVYYEHLSKVFNQLPAKEYTLDDLTPYIKS